MNKACPILLRHNHGRTEVLAFIHPLAGKQLVKGSIEAGETLEQACARELFEEAGVAATAHEYLGNWHSGYERQVWGFYVMTATEVLPDRWDFYTQDDGGHVFKFFWQPLEETPGPAWHSLYIGALDYLKSALIKP